MKRPLIVIATIVTLLMSAPLLAYESQLKCETGPIKKLYGETNWLVYSCADKKTLLVVSDTGNPAMPFYFTLYIKNGRYNLSGEGTGDTAATEAAYNELVKLKENDISALIEETKKVNNPED